MLCLAVYSFMLAVQYLQWPVIVIRSVTQGKEKLDIYAVSIKGKNQIQMKNISAERQKIVDIFFWNFSD